MELGDLKTLASKCVHDKPMKTSMRVAAAILYCVVRMGEIIDWWFPVRLPVTTMEDARRIWGETVSDETLQTWVNAMNKRQGVK
jgi:hypothetical protein